ncbi:class I SAM-dependent RNA methyltransferase [Magnetovibrio sp.]|uniref:THUMP domain-containing class I SAM-dependent RNA methyltransferase n=1 Tax=Magnetovibrio sp. TaxID=2024836 RepID=UPI002F95E431
MKSDNNLEIFLVATPGLEDVLRAEAVEKGFRKPTPVVGGVTIRGNWTDVWRANLEIRGASRVLVRIDAFRAQHLSQLDKRARQFAWGDILRPDVPIRVEATCKNSRIYHSGAAAQRIEQAIHDVLGAPISREGDVSIKARIEDNMCTISIDTSGATLHKRDHKEAVSKAPMRETLASLFLRQCGYKGNEPVVDPMCGSGTFVIEAAEIAAGLYPGRTRHFAFEHLVNFDETVWRDLRARPGRPMPDVHFFGYDRDAGAIRMSRANAERAGVAHLVEFAQQPVSELTPPDGPPGLVIVNPPYGSRIGNMKNLYPLYSALGQTLKERFSGWRVGLVTNADSLAKQTKLPFTQQTPPVSHGGISIKMYATQPLK